MRETARCDVRAGQLWWGTGDGKPRGHRWLLIRAAGRNDARYTLVDGNYVRHAWVAHLSVARLVELKWQLVSGPR